MLFNSYAFIFAFLPLALGGFYLLARWRHDFASAWLVLTSFAFYGWWNPPFVMLLAGSIAFNYAMGLALQSLSTRPGAQAWVLAGSVFCNLALLFYYKYFVYTLSLLVDFGLTVQAAQDDILLPLGISFFTFTQIGYLIDCRDGIAKGRRLLDYALFVTFFPHLIAGPILHHREMMPQFENRETFLFKAENLAVGASLFIIGLAKKVIVADRLAPLSHQGFSNAGDLSTPAAWSAALCYSLQLYFDFSGYSDMAIGLARMFGIRFPANFNSPYKAGSIIDFWQRWHMTLTRYLTLYLYNPVAMSITRRRLAAGKAVGRQGTATVAGFTSMVAFPTAFTMILAGIWHGAGLQYLIFGLLHAAYLTINHAWRTFGPRTAPTLLVRAGYILLTYLAVLVAQVFFRATSASDAIAMLSAMAGFSSALGINELAMAQNAEAIRIAHAELLDPLVAVKIALCFGIVFALPNSLELLSNFEPILGKFRPKADSMPRWRPSAGWGAAVGALGALSLLYLLGATEFLYFQF